jgi:hypothetical protein
MAEASSVEFTSGVPTAQVTPPLPPAELKNTQPNLNLEDDQDIEGQIEEGNITRNEILDRFFQNLDVARRPITSPGTIATTNLIDNVHDLRYAVPTTIYSQIGKSNMPPVLQDLYGKVQVAHSSHIFPRGSQACVFLPFHSHIAN